MAGMDLKPARALLAQRLREWRKSSGKPLKRVAQEFGVSHSTWARWEAGSRFPSAEFILLLANYIGVPVCDLFCFDEQARPHCRAKGRVKKM